jgi:beta-lactamase regulating signal transducer with metallopeptidase domain/uncharacterized GH25 family protein
MNTLADWYPGDALVFAGLEALGTIAILVLLTWAAEELLARRRAALASALWLTALSGVLVLPAIVLLGPRLPWRIGLLRPEEAALVWSTTRPSALEATAPPVVDAAPAGTQPEDESPRAVSPVMPVVSVKTRPASSRAGVKVEPAASAPGPRPVPEEAAAPGEESQARVHAVATAFVLIWICGSVWLTLRLLHGSCRVHRLRGRLRSLNDEAWSMELATLAPMTAGFRLPALFASADVRSPLLIGALRPRIVLPETLLERSTPQQIREIILHECAHVVRLDPWVRLLQRFAAVLFWVHPLVHFLNRRLDHAREEVCDNHVLAHAEAPEYAGTLLSIAQICYPTPNLGGYLTMIPRHHSLERRVEKLLDENRDTATRLPLVQRLAIVTTLVLLLAGISGIGLQPAASAQYAPGQAAIQEKNTAPGGAEKKSTPTATGKITGRVVHAAGGKPVSGADVRLLRRGTYSGEPPTRRTTANARGDFTFDAVAPGQYRVWSFHGNLASRTRMYQSDIVAVSSAGDSKPIVLKMRPGLNVRVKVVNEADSKPIAGARVRLIWTDTDRDRFTDAGGEVDLPALTSETWHIEASAKDHAAVTRILNLATEQPAALEFKLPPGGSVQGKITGEDGRPVARVGVNVYGGDDGSPLDYVETDAGGRYRFDHLPLGRTLKLYSNKLDYLAQWSSFSIERGNGRVARFDLVLKKRPHGGSVQGIVIDKESKPIAGAEVFNQGGSSSEVRQAKTDAQGKYFLDNVYGNHIGHELVVRARGFAPQRVQFTPGPAARPAEVGVQLEPGHRLKGRVVNEAGRPVAGVRVYFSAGNSPSGMFFGGSTNTDKQGRFQLDSLPPEAPFTFQADGYSQIPDKKLPLDGDKEVVVRLKSQGIIKGRVVDAVTGKPLPRFNVSITFSPDRQPDELVAGLYSSRTTPGETFVSAKGQFVLKDLMVGMPLQVSVTAAGYRRQVLRRVVTQTEPEAMPVDIQLTAEDPSKLVTVRGKLVNHKGQPVRGAELRLIAATDRPMQREDFPFNWQMIESGQIDQVANVLQVQRLTTGPDGSFVFARIPGDTEIELVYWGKGIPSARIDHLESLVAKERANLVIKAPASARITGTIDRKIFPEFSSIQLSGMSRFFQAKVAADKKTFVIDDLPAGDYEVQVYGPAVRVNSPDAFQTPVVGRRPVSLVEGKEERISLGEGDRSPGRQ